MTQRTILVAEDDRFLRRAAEVALTQRGFRVLTARDGQEALALARQHTPDLLLLDLLMPKLSGGQVLRALRADAATRALPVLILSNSSSGFDMQDAARLNVVGYWIKANISITELGDRVTALLEARQ
jgi:DNA-binding response OmpR family regulator